MEEGNKKIHDPDDRRPLVNETSAGGPQPGCLGQTGGQEAASFLLRNSVLRQELPPADPTHFPQNIPH